MMTVVPSSSLASDFGRLVGVEDLDGCDRALAVVEDAVQKADENIVALFRAKDFFEGKIGFGIDEDHGRGVA